MDHVADVWNFVTGHATVISVVISTIATAAIAIYTFRLTAATTAQAKLTNDVLTLARDEFNATHRPYLVIREVYWTPPDDPGGIASIAYTLINSGGSACRVEESVLRYRSDIEGTMPIDTKGVNDIGPVTLTSGDYRFLRCPMVSEGEQVATAAHELGFLSDHCFRGAIVYSDDKGIHRRMAFRRICYRDGQRHKASYRFVTPSDNDEYEYTD